MVEKIILSKSTLGNKIAAFLTLSLLIVGIYHISADGLKQDEYLLLFGTVAMTIFALFFFRHLLQNLAEKVEDHGDHILVKKGNKQESIKLNEISDVTIASMQNPVNVIITTSKPTELGQKIHFPCKTTFMNQPHPHIKNFIERVDEARQTS